MISKKTKTVDERIAEHKKKFLESLGETLIIQEACKKAGISRATLYRWRNRDHDFNKQVTLTLERGVDKWNDIAESVILARVKKGDVAAAKFFLRNNHIRYRNKINLRVDNNFISDLDRNMWNPGDSEDFEKEQSHQDEIIKPVIQREEIPVVSDQTILKDIARKTIQEAMIKPETALILRPILETKEDIARKKGEKERKKRIAKDREIIKSISEEAGMPMPEMNDAEIEKFTSEFFFIDATERKAC
jgi:predicted DNA-binding transcriptional regulator AlpA